VRASSATCALQRNGFFCAAGKTRYTNEAGKITGTVNTTVTVTITVTTVTAVTITGTVTTPA